MIVQEDFQVLADNEHVEQLLMHHLKTGDRPVLPWIMDGEGNARSLSGFDGSWTDAQIEVIFHRIRKTRNQSHTAARALTRVVRAHIRIHGANVDLVGVLRRKRSYRSLGNGKSQDQGDECSPHK